MSKEVKLQPSSIRTLGIIASGGISTLVSVGAFVAKESWVMEASYVSAGLWALALVSWGFDFVRFVLRGSDIGSSEKR